MQIDTTISHAISNFWLRFITRSAVFIIWTCCLNDVEKDHTGLLSSWETVIFYVVPFNIVGQTTDNIICMDNEMFD